MESSSIDARYLMSVCFRASKYNATSERGEQQFLHTVVSKIRKPESCSISVT